MCRASVSLHQFTSNIQMGKNCYLADFHHGIVFGKSWAGLNISEIANLLGSLQNGLSRLKARIVWFVGGLQSETPCLWKRYRENDQTGLIWQEVCNNSNRHPLQTWWAKQHKKVSIYKSTIRKRKSMGTKTTANKMIHL